MMVHGFTVSQFETEEETVRPMGSGPRGIMDPSEHGPASLFKGKISE